MEVKEEEEEEGEGEDDNDDNDSIQKLPEDFEYPKSWMTSFPSSFEWLERKETSLDFVQG